MPEVDGYYGDPFGLKFGAGSLSLMEVEESPEVASLISISFIKMAMFCLCVHSYDEVINGTGGFIKNTSPSSILQLTPPALLESCAPNAKPLCSPNRCVQLVFSHLFHWGCAR